MPLLDAGPISFSYADRAVLREVSLSLRAGQVTVLLGPNGSGKSTLLRLLAGHLGTANRVLWNDRPIAEYPRRELAKLVAYLPQFPTAAEHQTVAETLRTGRIPYLSAFGIESREDVDAVAEVAELLHLTDLLDRPLDELSGGQRQRAFIARCLAQRPKALLLDEPATFLDLKHHVELLTLLRRLADTKGLAILMASHDLNLPSAYADTLLLLDDGATAAAGPPGEVLKPELLSRVYGVSMSRTPLLGPVDPDPSPD
jgi:ferric hydroxamate transport system ATP-binding protein